MMLNTKKLKEDILKEFLEKFYKLNITLQNIKKNTFLEQFMILLKNKFLLPEVSRFPFKELNTFHKKESNILLNLDKSPEQNMTKLNTKLENHTQPLLEPKYLLLNNNNYNNLNNKYNNLNN